MAPSRKKSTSDEAWVYSRQLGAAIEIGVIIPKDTFRELTESQINRLVKSFIEELLTATLEDSSSSNDPIN